MRLAIITLALSPVLGLLAEQKIETRTPDFPLVMVDQAAPSIFPDSWLKANAMKVRARESELRASAAMVWMC